MFSAEKLVTGLQRPFIFILMLVACPAMMGLSIWAIVDLIFPVLSGSIPTKEGVNPVLVYSLLFASFLIPLLLSWVSFKLAKKAWIQMKEQGIVYK